MIEEKQYYKELSEKIESDLRWFLGQTLSLPLRKLVLSAIKDKVMIALNDAEMNDPIGNLISKRGLQIDVEEESCGCIKISPCNEYTREYFIKLFGNKDKYFML